MKVLFAAIAMTLLALAGVSSAADLDVTRKPSCSYCGMDRDKFAYSRMLVTYDDGTETATCSIHCAAVDMAVNIDRAPTSIRVGEYKTRRLVDAETAYWVIGGAKSGVMSARAKWAFADRKDADAFVAANGGAVAGFEDAIKAAYEDLYADTKTIRDRRKMKRMKMHPQPTETK